MSKKKGHRARKPKRQHPAACPRCHTPADSSPGALLTALAAVLNGMADAGIKVRLDHGFAETTQGYVLPLKAGRWTARTLAYDPVEPRQLAGPDD